MKASHAAVVVMPRLNRSLPILVKLKSPLPGRLVRPFLYQENPMNDPVEMAASLCRTFEGLRLAPYLCPRGYWTIGYGSRFLANGAAVTARTPPITAVQADALLLLTLQRLRPEVRQLVQVTLSVGVEAALLDFAFNLGLTALAGSTLLKLLNAGHAADAAGQLLLWDHIHKNGQLITLPGLTRRRQAEWRLWTEPA